MANNTDNLSLALHIVGAQEVVSALKSVAASGSLIGAVAAGIGVTAGAIAGLGIEAMRAAAEHEHLAVRMRAVFGTQQGDAALKWAESLAFGVAGAVYSVEELGDAILRLRSQGLNPTTFMPALMEMGAALGKERMEQIAGIAARIQQLGNFGGRMVRLFIGTGIDLAKILREQLGMSVKQVMDLGKEGIKASVFLPALVKGLQQAYGGTMSKWAQTWDGMMNMLRSKFGLLKEQIGAPLLAKLKDALQHIGDWILNPKNLDKILVFSSYLAAGFTTAYDVAKEMMKQIFEGKIKAPLWLLQIELSMLRILEYAVTIKAVMAGAQLGAMVGGPIGSLIGGSIGLMIGTAASAVMNAMYGEPIKKQMRTARAAGSEPISKKFEDNRLNLLEEWRKGTKGLFSKAVPNLTVPPVGGAGSAGGAVMKAVEAVIIGGAERARRGVKAMELGGSYAPGAHRPRVDIHWHSDGKGGPIDKAVQTKAEDVCKQVIIQLVRAGWGPLAPAH